MIIRWTAARVKSLLLRLLLKFLWEEILLRFLHGKVYFVDRKEHKGKIFSTGSE
jgi:hypothetical protein